MRVFVPAAASAKKKKKKKEGCHPARRRGRGVRDLWRTLQKKNGHGPLADALDQRRQLGALEARPQLLRPRRQALRVRRPERQGHLPRRSDGARPADLEGRDKMNVCLRGRYAAGGRDAALSDGRDLSLVYLTELRRISV